ncbi:hypothetical protein HOLleu_29294 [Holothuria leucospilota]|uniref:Uncharacterized protein n=1 Tax=Holothuria leucospilota TaxID=206669 RepID=A0A9Q1H1L1_HOLLE|nr:hypothetical protein HOLleu_29294 [Holothuria leucospilota]
MYKSNWPFSITLHWMFLEAKCFLKGNQIKSSLVEYTTFRASDLVLNCVKHMLVAARFQLSPGPVRWPAIAFLKSRNLLASTPKKADPDFGGGNITTCFPSKAPLQFGKFDVFLNPSSTDLHSSSEVGIFRETNHVLKSRPHAPVSEDEATPQEAEAETEDLLHNPKIGLEACLEARPGLKTSTTVKHTYWWRWCRYF